MAEITQWGYRVESLGSFLRAAVDAEIETILNEMGEEGWKVFSLEKPSPPILIKHADLRR